MDHQVRIKDQTDDRIRPESLQNPSTLPWKGFISSVYFSVFSAIVRLTLSIQAITDTIKTNT